MAPKRCTKCGSEGPFAKDNRNKSGLAARCKACVYKNTRKWVKENHERHREYYRKYEDSPKQKLYRRNWVLIKKYGITHEDYLQMVQNQSAGCAICSGPASSKDGYFHIDHDHETGKVRALLCHFCNTGLGSMKDSIETLENAVSYLKKHKRGNTRSSQLLADQKTHEPRNNNTCIRPRVRQDR